MKMVWLCWVGQLNTPCPWCVSHSFVLMSYTIRYFNQENKYWWKKRMKFLYRLSHLSYPCLTLSRILLRLALQVHPASLIQQKLQLIQWSIISETPMSHPLLRLVNPPSHFRVPDRRTLSVHLEKTRPLCLVILFITSFLKSNEPIPMTLLSVAPIQSITDIKLGLGKGPIYICIFGLYVFSLVTCLCVVSQ